MSRQFQYGTNVLSDLCPVPMFSNLVPEFPYLTSLHNLKL